jgi:hypothetical protein
VPPTTQEVQLRQRNEVVTRVLQEEEQRKSPAAEGQPVGDNFREPLGLSSGAFALLGDVRSTFRYYYRRSPMPFINVWTCVNLLMAFA